MVWNCPRPSHSSIIRNFSKCWSGGLRKREKPVHREIGQAEAAQKRFTAKLGVVIEEADETVLWLELLAESGIVKPARLRDLLEQANQLLAIFAASWRSLKH
jgi:hypothetical protein